MKAGNFGKFVMDQEILIRKSPFQYLKWVVIIEFFFALTPLVLSILLGFSEDYESFTLSGTISYTLLITIGMTTLQVIILGLAFAAWFFQFYRLTDQAIFYSSSLTGDRKLVEIQSISGIAVKQGPLARRLNYGTLIIHGLRTKETARLKDIPNPLERAAMMAGLVAPEVAPRVLPDVDSIPALLKGGESQHVEYKSSLLWDYHRLTSNKDLYEPVMKGLAAFMNTGGGTLLIGVDDEGIVLGLEADFRAIKKPNNDGFESVFNNAFNQMVGAEFRPYIQVMFHEVDGKTICVLLAQPSPRPVYLQYKGVEKFYIRTGNSNQPLSVSKATQYIQTHFGN